MLSTQISGLYLENLGGERSRLWMLRQGKRAEEAGMISLTKNSANKINGSTNTAELRLAA